MQERRNIPSKPKKVRRAVIQIPFVGGDASSNIAGSKEKTGVDAEKLVILTMKRPGLWSHGFSFTVKHW